MSLKGERDLSPTGRNQYNRAKAAAQAKNYDYAIALTKEVLKEEPLFLDGRRFLRGVEIQKYKAMSGFSRQITNLRNTGGLMKFSSGKRTPQEQLIVAEDMLEQDPFHLKANVMVAEAGVALGYPIFKCFAYETLAIDKPADKAILNTLAQAYMEADDPAKAEKTYEKIIEIDPRDGDALSGLKNASARNASRVGKWDTATDYRDVLKSKTEASQLEQEGKVVKSSEAIEEQIRINYEKHQADPANPNYPKLIASLCEQKNDFATAVNWYQYAFEVGGKVDSSMEKKVGDLRVKAAEGALNDLRTQAEAQEDPEQRVALQAAIETKEKELDEVRLALAEARVRAQPNEGEFRYELGEALYRTGQYKRATEELQQSLKQPSVRYQALNLLGLSFMKRGMLDFAANRLNLAESELLAMDNMKKEVTYNLGLVYELQKEPVKALDQFKKIYEVDMGYRDVSARVEASYGNGDSA